MDEWERRERKKIIKRILKKAFAIVMIILSIVFLIWFGKWYCGGTYQLHYYIIGACVSGACVLLVWFFSDWLY